MTGTLERPRGKNASMVISSEYNYSKYELLDNDEDDEGDTDKGDYENNVYDEGDPDDENDADDENDDDDENAAVRNDDSSDREYDGENDGVEDDIKTWWSNLTITILVNALLYLVYIFVVVQNKSK